MVAGSHRLQACDLLGHSEIACIVVDDDDLHAELAMIDENLVRSELSPTERARQTARRKESMWSFIPEPLMAQTLKALVWPIGHSRNAIVRDGYRVRQLASRTSR